MDSLELDRDQALVSLENAIRRVLKTGIPSADLADEIAVMIEAAERRQRVAKLREKKT